MLTINDDKAKVIDSALAFLVLALTISHPVDLAISGGKLEQLEPISLQTQQEMHVMAHHHVSICLSVLLERVLRRLLSLIHESLDHSRRDDWVPASFALCLLLMGVESLQVDIYLNEESPSAAITAMESSAVNALVDLFQKSTNGLNPLTIDWGEQRNWDLLGADPDMIYAMQDLQDLAQEYGKSRSPCSSRRVASFISSSNNVIRFVSPGASKYRVYDARYRLSYWEACVSSDAHS